MSTLTAAALELCAEENARLTARVAELEAGIRELAVAMSGVGGHGESCVFPDTPCSCGLAEFRVAARALVGDETPETHTDQEA